MGLRLQSNQGNESRRCRCVKESANAVVAGNTVEVERDIALVECDWVEISRGERYKGQWKNSHRHGKGTLTKPSGWKYDGQFIEDKARLRHSAGFRWLPVPRTMGKKHDAWDRPIC